MEIVERKQMDQDFQHALRRTFVHACQAPSDDGRFLRYPEKHEHLERTASVPIWTALRPRLRHSVVVFATLGSFLCCYSIAHKVKTIFGCLYVHIHFYTYIYTCEYLQMRSSNDTMPF